jgi:hypothetical protein
VNQLGLEEEIRSANLPKTCKDDPKQHIADEKTESPVDGLSDIDIASKRFFEGLHSNAAKIEGFEDAWKLAEEVGIPFCVNAKTFWYNWRQTWFTRIRVKEDLSSYGGHSRAEKIFTEHGRQSGWWAMLNHLAAKDVAVESLEDEVVKLRFTSRGYAWVAEVLNCTGASQYALSPCRDVKTKDEQE